MEIIIGKYSGFCNGVAYTVTRANQELEENNCLYSLGEIVHNEEVIKLLKSKGLKVKNSIDEVPNNASLIIRAHGESINIYEKAKEKGINIIDLTCGRVKLIHNKILKHKNDCYVLIIGKKNHPETIAHNSYSPNSSIIENIDDIKDAYDKYCQSNLKKVYVVVQTTFNELLFKELITDIQQVFKNAEIILDNTICKATFFRQEEVALLAQKVDKMLIIGGRNSSNTKELANIASLYCKNVYLIQTYEDLNDDMFSANDIIGIEAGASTPQQTVDEVVNYLNSIYIKPKLLYNKIEVKI